MALAIANSPLVKTAIAGQDANWGRIVMAVGKSGAAADRDLLTIRFGDILVAEKGWRAESYTEEAGAAAMAAPDIRIDVVKGKRKKLVDTIVKRNQKPFENLDATWNGLKENGRVAPNDKGKY